MSLKNTPVVAKTPNLDFFEEYFHTALRKTCSSKPTSLMWNLIHLVKSPAWKVICDNVREQVGGHSFDTIDNFALAVRNAWVKYEIYNATERLKKEHRTMDETEFKCLQLCGTLMNREDWENAVSYLWEA
jgi:hypothetical protein